MRILVVNGFFPPRATGSAHFSSDVAREWSRLGHHVTVLTTGAGDHVERETSEGVEVVRLPARRIRMGSLAFGYALPFVARRGVRHEVRRIIRDVAPDVIHQNGQYFDLTFLTTWLAWREGIPRVLTIHTPLVHTSPVKRFVIAAVDRSALRVLNAPGRPVVVGVDRFICDLVQSRYHPASGPVRFVPATLEVQRFSDGDGGLVRSRHQLGDGPVVLSLGHVIPLRSRLPLVRAMPELVRRWPGLRVVVVGEVYDRRFQELAAELHVERHLVVVGAVAHDEVRHYLAAADVECHDLDGHTLGITTMEAMAAGVPVVASVRRDVFPGIDLSRWPALRIVDQAEPHDIAVMIDELLGTPALRREVAEQQLDLVRTHFDRAVVGAAYEGLFAGIVARSAHPVQRSAA